MRQEGVRGVWEAEKREELILLSFLAPLALEKLGFKALERSLQFIVSFRLACVMGTQHGLREAGAAFEGRRDRRLSTREAEC